MDWIPVMLQEQVSISVKYAGNPLFKFTFPLYVFSDDESIFTYLHFINYYLALTHLSVHNLSLIYVICVFLKTFKEIYSFVILKTYIVRYQ